MDNHDGPCIESGKVLIKYQLDQPHEYRVHPESVRPLPDKGGCKPNPSAEDTVPKKASRVDTSSASSIGPHTRDPKTIHVYTDGASSGNPGPAGIGIFLKYGVHQKEISHYIGIATNNIAELEAIRTGLSLIRNPDLPVRVYTDSNYALGLLTRGWKPKKNQVLITSIQALMKTFKELKLVKVKGHAGDEGNEIADRLATGAIKDR